MRNLKYDSFIEPNKGAKTIFNLYDSLYHPHQFIGIKTLEESGRKRNVEKESMGIRYDRRERIFDGVRLSFYNLWFDNLHGHGASSLIGKIHTSSHKLEKRNLEYEVLILRSFP